MRTLRQLDNEAMDLAKARAEELCGKGNESFFGITKNEIIAFQSNLRFGDKYREMYAILKDVEKLLAGMSDGDDETQEILKKIRSL